MVDFLFEMGMLKKTPRTGYQFLGSGNESVAEHSFRVAIIGYMLSLHEPAASTYKTVLMCLFHDIHEARTGDRNYVNKRYVRVDEERAIRDLAEKLTFGDEIISLTDEFRKGDSLEAQISKDADQLDLILELKEQQDLGNQQAGDWLHYAVKRLLTRNARIMAGDILKSASTRWWFDKRTEWWVNGPTDDQKASE